MKLSKKKEEVVVEVKKAEEVKPSIGFVTANFSSEDLNNLAHKINELIKKVG